MKRFAKITFGALLLAGGAVAMTVPAQARVSVGIGIGVGPGYGGYYAPPAPVCDPYSRYYDPYRCAPYDSYYYDPIWFDGAWISGPLPYRYYGGHPEFYIHGGWHGDVRFGSGGFHGGSVRHGAPHGGGGFHGGGHGGHGHH